MCTKTTYDTFHEASRVLSGFHKGSHHNRHRATKKPKRAYKCEVCGKYHLTSQKKKSSEGRYKGQTGSQDTGSRKQ